MASKRRPNSVVIELPSEEGGKPMGPRVEEKAYDFVNRSKFGGLLNLRSYYVLDGFRKTNGISHGEMEIHQRGKDKESTMVDHKMGETRNRDDPATTTPGKFTFKETGDSEQNSEIVQSNSAQKPRTVRQQKNKRKRKELEKEQVKNERWRSPSGGSEGNNDCHQITVVPVSYDERPVDCGGLRLGENGKGCNHLRTSLSMFSIPTAFDATHTPKTKSKKSRLRRLSQIFDWNQKRKSDQDFDTWLKNAVCHFDTGQWSAPKPPGKPLDKAKSQTDLSTMITPPRVMLMGKNGLHQQYLSSTDQFRKEFVQGWWSSKLPDFTPSSIKVQPTAPDPPVLCKSIDSGYDSPEIVTRSTTGDTNVAEGESTNQTMQSYEPFDSTKASLFNEYFGKENGELDETTADESEETKETEQQSNSHVPGKLDLTTGDLDEVKKDDGLEEMTCRAIVDSQCNHENGDVVEQASDRIDDSTGEPGYTVITNSDEESAIVVAIDLGTTYSGYAYAFHGQNGDDLVYLMRRMNNTGPTVFSPKWPTCLLLDPDGQFHSFGWDALDSYHDLEPELARRYLYFQSFRTILCGEGLHRGVNAVALNGVSWPMMDVLAHCLRYLRRQALDELSEFANSTMLSCNIQWIVTVPAGWDHAAKQLVRIAAYEADMGSLASPRQLVIALEVEAVALYCCTLKENDALPHMTTHSLPSSLKQKSATKRDAYRPDVGLLCEPEAAYMVVDCGGGKVDIMVHRVDDDGGISQVHRAIGVAHGSNEVNRAFDSLLCEIFSIEFMDQFRARYPAAYVDLMSSFELRKRSAHPYKTSPFNIALPFAFMEFYKRKYGHRVECAVKRCDKKQHVTWNPQGMLRLSPELMSFLFTSTLVGITTLIEEALEAIRPASPSYLFLVGGFAESALLQHEIRNAFGSRVKVVIPNQASTATLQGALRFGLHPEKINCRRSALSFGISVLHPFDPLHHPIVKQVSKNDRHWCKDVFEKFVSASEELDDRHRVVRHYCPAALDQQDIVVQIYCSPSPEPYFVTDHGVKRCAVLKIDLSADTGETELEGIREKEVKVSIGFGGTELKLEAVDAQNGTPVAACIDFLNL